MAEHVDKSQKEAAQAPQGPLTGITIVECGHALAGPLASTLLADFGATVYKVEPPGGDSLRNMGPKYEGLGLWWSVTGRNKHSVCIDIKNPRGNTLLRELLAKADVLVENFRPGVMDRLGFSWDALKRDYPHLIVLSISGFGQSGPYSQRGGFGKIAEGFSGATFLTGERDGPPTHPGYSLADATSGLMGAFGIMLALRDRDRGGSGQRIDLALYEPLLRMIEWQLPVLAKTGQLCKRNGSKFPFDGAFITGLFESADGHSVIVSAATTESVRTLRALLVEKGELPETSNSDQELIAALSEWIRRHARDEVMTELEARKLVCGPVFSARDILDDPHMNVRGSVSHVADGSGGTIPMPAALPMLSSSPGKVRWGGQRLGQDTDAVLGPVLNLSQDDLQRLRDDRVIV